MEEGILKKISEKDQAIEFHKSLDALLGKESPNDSWPPFLIEYYNNKQQKEVTKNESNSGSS